MVAGLGRRLWAIPEIQVDPGEKMDSAWAGTPILRFLVFPADPPSLPSECDLRVGCAATYGERSVNSPAVGNGGASFPGLDTDNLWHRDWLVPTASEAGGLS